MIRNLKSLSSEARTRVGLRALLPLGVLGAACSTILGIEDVHSGPAPGSEAAGEGATGGSGGQGGSTTGGKGGSAGAAVAGHGGTSGGSSGSAGKGGSETGGTMGGSNAQGGSGNAGSAGKGPTGGRGGAGGAGGTSVAGEAGAGGGVVGDPTVRGRVVNHWMQPIPGVTVSIGGVTADTDSDGKFQIPDVTETYDAQMVVSFKRYGNDGPQYGWIYEGLTRRDPTLEVYEGLSLKEANIEFTPEHVPGAAGEVIAAAFGGQYGNWSRQGPDAVYTSADWYGPNEVTMHAYGLSWIAADDLPTSYTAYNALSSPIALTDSSGTTAFALDYTPNTVSAGAISGSVTSTTTDERDNGVWVRFATGAQIQVADHYGSSLTPDFTYTVPSVPNSSITIAAKEGDSYRGSMALAHADALSAGTSNIALAIPTPPTLNAPASGTTVSDSTAFSWAGSAKTYVWMAISENWYEGIYVVTSKKQMTMPKFDSGFTLRPGDTSVWRVETHGQTRTVDDLAGPDGLDEFGFSQGDSPEGASSTSGTYSISIGREIITP